MRRDRDGSVIDDVETDIPADECSCLDGWRGEDFLGRPIPCTTCRPWLRREVWRRDPRIKPPPMRRRKASKIKLAPPDQAVNQRRTA